MSNPKLQDSWWHLPLLSRTLPLWLHCQVCSQSRSPKASGGPRHSKTIAGNHSNFVLRTHFISAVFDIGEFQPEYHNVVLIPWPPRWRRGRLCDSPLGSTTVEPWGSMWSKVTSLADWMVIPSITTLPFGNVPSCEHPTSTTFFASPLTYVWQRTFPRWETGLFLVICIYLAIRAWRKLCIQNVRSYVPLVNVRLLWEDGIRFPCGACIIDWKMTRIICFHSKIL